MGRISPGPTRWPPGAERRLVPAKSNLKPQTSSGSLKKRTEEPLGNLNKVYRAHLMHRVHAGKGGGTLITLTQPGGELLLGLPTLLTMHRVNAEVKRTQNNPIASYKQA